MIIDEQFEPIFITKGVIGYILIGDWSIEQKNNTFKIRIQYYDFVSSVQFKQDCEMAKENYKSF